SERFDGALEVVVGFYEVVYSLGSNLVIASHLQGVGLGVLCSFLIQRQGNACDGILDGVALRNDLNAVDGDLGVPPSDRFGHSVRIYRTFRIRQNLL